jgi:GNAT superfamily N-acetyltransferase
MTLPPLFIRPLSPETLPDFLAYMDGEAFADNPQWHFCYCQYMYVDHAKVKWGSLTAGENRDSACERIRSGQMQGYLAYRQDKPVGWCGAAPRLLLPAFADQPDPDAARLGQITCFVVAQAHRRTGVAKSLLEAACEGFRQQGLTIAEASPREDAKSDAQHYHGPLAMYLAAGFVIHRAPQNGVSIVRRAL